ncbi:MAG: GAF domain-containing protein, partial [Thermodesulfovibrionales bacterium]|nr:GAF domain-containing protein [Thermodesulfovibrionales bacterium]
MNQTDIKDLSLTLLDNLPFPIIFIDLDYSIRFVNSTGYNIVRDIFRVDEKTDLQECIDYLYSTIKTEIENLRLEKSHVVSFKRVVSVHNTDYFFLITLKNIFDSDGNLTGTIIFIQDNSENVKLDAMLCMDVQLSEALNNLAKAILQSMSLDEIAVLTLDNAQRFTNSKYGFAGHIDPNTGYLVVPTHTRDIWDICKVQNKSIEFKDFTGLWGWVLNNKKPLLTNEPWQDKRRSGTPKGHVPIDRFLAVPSLVGDNLVGMIAVANGEYPYTERDLDILERISSLFALAVQHKFEQERLEYKKNALQSANEELKSMQAQIIQQEKMASIGQLSAGIAHEINNPMGYIISNLSTLTKYILRMLEFYEVQREIIDSVIKNLMPDRQEEIINL